MSTFAQPQRSATLSRMADQILKSGRAQHADQGSRKEAGSHRVTVEWIKQNATPAGGYKAAQVRLIGVNYPLPHGWMQKAEGRIISGEAKRKFESFHEGYKATNKSKAVLAAVKERSITVAGCNCDVLPWEDCEHTVDDAEAEAMLKLHC